MEKVNFNKARKAREIFADGVKNSLNDDVTLGFAIGIGIYNGLKYESFKVGVQATITTMGSSAIVNGMLDVFTKWDEVKKA